MDGNSSETKEKIFNTAIALFHTKGYKGTTIRAIAASAKVNSANISYYFNGKQGLLEACFIRFFEPYIACLEEEVQNLSEEGLKRAAFRILHFQSENHLLSRFVWREVTVDSQIVREILSTYFMKERYLLKNLPRPGVLESRRATELSHDPAEKHAVDAVFKQPVHSGSMGHAAGRTVFCRKIRQIGCRMAGQHPAKRGAQPEPLLLETAF